MTADREAVLAALRGVTDPETGRNIVESGAVQGLVLADGAARFLIEIDPARARALEPMREAAEAAVRAVPGVEKATAVLTAHSPAPGGAAAAAAKGPPPDLGGARGGARSGGAAAPPADGRIPGVARIVAVASGKGGVGKSTVSSNLALALAAEGARVGLLDADVYGPSQPRMLGVGGKPHSDDGTTIQPLRSYGLTIMSMGFLLDEDQSVVWRGPMLQSALTQMLHQVAWGDLDFLIVDLPPGTGDVQLTLSQKAALTGAVVVSTPQDVALLDVRKALDMFRKVETPVIGMIENMSGFVCPSCGAETDIFGHGGAKREAERLGLPFLGEIPLDLGVRVTSDAGAPIVASRPESVPAQRFRAIARRVMELTGAA